MIGVYFKGLRAKIIDSDTVHRGNGHSGIQLFFHLFNIFNDKLKKLMKELYN